MGAPQQAGGLYLHSHRIGRSLAAILLGGFALIGAAQAQTWSKIADENQSFSVSGTQTVRYGAGTSWVQMSVSGSGTCSNAFFGSDPIEGTVKQCDLLVNGSFKAPSVGTGQNAYAYTVAGATWVFSEWAGITGNGSGFTSDSPNAPDGAQAAFIQNNGTATQTLTLAAGTYSISFQAVQRGGYQQGTQILRVTIDGATVGTYQPPSAGAYGASPAYTFTVTAGSHTVQLAGVGSGSDYTAFVDAVSIVSTSGGGGTLPAPPVSPLPVVNYEYDAQGNPTRTIQAPGTSGFGFATTSTYDKLNRQKDSTDAKAGVTRFDYNGREDVTQLTDPRNLVTQTPRNGLGDATSLVSPDTGTATHTYDAAGNLKTRTDSRGVLATYSYDALNRLTGIVYSQSGQTSLSYSWNYDQTGAGYANGIGRLTSTSHPAGSTQYTYDPQGRVLTDTQRVTAATGANPAQVAKTVTYGYDAAGHVTSIVYPSGRVLGVTYTAGQPTALALAKDSGSTPTTLISAIQWEPFGAVKSWNWQMASGAQAHERVYDASGRLVRYRLGNTIRDITYDAGDRITAYTHYDATSAAATPSLDQGFGYDELGRLTGITTATASWTIGYDANGNRTGVTLNSNTSTYTTAATSNRLTSISNPSRSFGYDNAGNTTSDSTSYTSIYNLAGRLATLTKAGTTSSFSHDGMGRRVRKAGSAGAASTVVFVYDQQGQLLGEYDSAGNTIREYVWLGTTPVAIFTPDPANANNPPLVYFIHADHLDTPRVVIDKNNAVRWRWLAEPFGTTAPENNPSSLGVFTQNLRFPGQYADTETGLNYNFFRDYDPSTGRYAQSDPIGLEGGINTYAYVESNPLSNVDPNGLMGFGGGGSAGRGQPGPTREPQDFSPCDYYQQMCQKTGCRYYCFTGPLVCRNAQAAPSWFSYFGASKLNCVRRCLVREDQKVRKDKCDDKNCLSDSEIDQYHQTCFTECGVPPGAYPGVNPPWLPFNGNKQ